MVWATVIFYSESYHRQQPTNNKMSNKTKSHNKGAFGSRRRTNGIKLVQMGYNPSPLMRQAKAKIKAMKAQGFRKKG